LVLHDLWWVGSEEEDSVSCGVNLDGRLLRELVFSVPGIFKIRKCCGSNHLTRISHKAHENQATFCYNVLI